MAGLTTYGMELNDLLTQAKRLTSSASSLFAIFAEEASRLNRLDEASRLKKLYLSVNWHLERLRSSESAAHYGHSQGKLMATLGELAVSAVVGIASGNKEWTTLTKRMFETPVGRERPFGMVMVCIGPKGLPNEIEAISISELARQSNRSESEVINILQENGYLVLNANAFSLLIDRLVDDVLEGRLRLPISSDELAEITATGRLKPQADNQE